MPITEKNLVLFEEASSVVKHAAALPIYLGIAYPQIGQILFTTPHLAFAVLVGIGAGITAQATAEMIKYVRNPNKTPLNTLRMLSLVLAAALFDTALIGCAVLFSTTIAMLTPYLLLASTSCMAMRNLFGFVENMYRLYTAKSPEEKKMYAMAGSEHAIKFIGAALVTALIVCLFFTPVAPIIVAVLAFCAALFTACSLTWKFTPKKLKCELKKDMFSIFSRRENNTNSETLAENNRPMLSSV